MERLKKSVLGALLITTVIASASAATNTVNLSQFPDTGLPVPSGTILSNQWQSVGILFSARVGATPIGLAAHGAPPYFILASPDVFGAVNVFTFVDTNSFEEVHADYFSLIAGMQFNETAELAGLNELGDVLVQTNYTRTTGGPDFVPVTLEISGDFARVELRTQGNPGIGASDIRFQTLEANSGSPRFSLDWFTVDGGGGESSGSRFAIHGTIGQPDASEPMSGGTFSVTGGFWSLIAVQIPGGPKLSIEEAGPGLATISWTPNTPGFVLQESEQLSPANWMNSVSTTNNPVTVPAGMGRRYYRLHKP